MFKFLSICSGIEAASVAFTPLGWEAVGFSEIEPFPSAVLAHHYGSNMPDEPLCGNGVPNFGDFTKIALLPPVVDILCGGTPCQAFSVAGKRMSLADARGNLTLAFAVLAHELADSHGMRNALWENVPGTLSTKDNAFGCFLGALVGGDGPIEPVAKPARGKSNKFWRWRNAGTELDDDGNEVAFEEGHITRWPSVGMVAGPLGRAAWRVFDAQYFSLAQRRARLFVVYDPGNGADPAAVLFESQGMYRDSPPSREAGQRVAGTLSARTEGGGGLGTDFELGGGLTFTAAGHADYRHGLGTIRASGGDADPGSENLVVAPEIARCVATREGASQDYETTTMIACAIADSLTVGTNQTTGFVGDICAHTIAFDARQSDVIQYGDMSGPLDTEGHSIAVAIQGTMIGRGNSAGPAGCGYDDSGAMYTLTKTDVLAVAFGIPVDTTGHQGDHVYAPGDVWNCLSAQGGNNGDGAGGLLLDAVAFDMRGREGGAQFEGPHDTANIRAASGGSSRSYVAHAVNISDSVARVDDVMAPLVAEPGSAQQSFILRNEPQWAVRRLTPKECERLQGFPDDYTRIPWRGKPAEECPDGPRYKALGNSWAVPCVRWIAARIDAELKRMDNGLRHKQEVA